MKRILVIMTASLSSRHALDEAIALGTRSGARLCMVRIVPSRAPSMASYETWLDEVEKLVPPTMRDGAVALLGPAVEAIVNAADAYKPDVVVCGEGPHRALMRMDARHELGRVAPKVLVVPRASSTLVSVDKRRGEPSTPMGRVA